MASGMKVGDASNVIGGFPDNEIAREQGVKKTEVKVVFVPDFYRGNRKVT